MSSKTVVFTFLIFQYGGCHFISDGEGPVQVKKYIPIPSNERKVPDSYDWRDHGGVSPVKNQLTCNACWAFSIVANVESQYRIQLNQKVTLSEQFLIDCVKNSEGCSGPAPILATICAIISDLGGVLSEEDYYPYANRNMACRWNRPSNRNLLVKNNRTSAVVNAVDPMSNKKKYTLKNGDKEVKPVIGMIRVSTDEQEMADAVYKLGPLIAAINSASMANYTNGIDEPTEDKCDPKELNHTVLIVGYSTYVNPDTGDETPYWIIKNSYGSEWGDNGFYYLVRGRNACGIASDVTTTFVPHN